MDRASYTRAAGRLDPIRGGSRADAARFEISPSASMPPGFSWPPGIRAAACFTFDVDAESGILFDRPEAAGWLDVMTHQAYGPRTGVPRLLRLLDRLGVRATFFIPGYTAERWPAPMLSIRDAGHEIGHHGYLHESSRGVDENVEEAQLVRGLEALDSVLSVRPTGYRSPSWATSYALPALLARHGFRYDSGLMDADHPYVLGAANDPALTIVELPVHWSLDDWEPYTYLLGISGSGVIADPADVVGRWARELEALVDEGGLFVLTMHPFLSGRPSRAVALESLIERALAIEGLWIATCDEIALHVETLDLPAIVHEPPVLPEGP